MRTSIICMLHKQYRRSGKAELLRKKATPCAACFPNGTQRFFMADRRCFRAENLNTPSSVAFDASLFNLTSRLENGVFAITL